MTMWLMLVTASPFTIVYNIRSNRCGLTGPDTMTSKYGWSAAHLLRKETIDGSSSRPMANTLNVFYDWLMSTFLKSTRENNRNSNHRLRLHMLQHWPQHWLFQPRVPTGPVSWKFNRSSWTFSVSLLQNNKNHFWSSTLSCLLIHRNSISSRQPFSRWRYAHNAFSLFEEKFSEKIFIRKPSKVFVRFSFVDCRFVRKNEFSKHRWLIKNRCSCSSSSRFSLWLVVLIEEENRLTFFNSSDDDDDVKQWLNDRHSFALHFTPF